MLNAIRYGNVATAANYQTSTYNYIPDSVKINIIREGVNASNAFTASNATSLIDTLANKIGDKIGSGNYTFIAQLDGKTIFKETVSQNKMYKSQTGRSAFL
jgi:predicted lipoprotein